MLLIKTWDKSQYYEVTGAVPLDAEVLPSSSPRFPETQLLQVNTDLIVWSFPVFLFVSLDASFDVLGEAPYNLLSVTLSASQKLFTQRGTLIGLRGNAENVSQTAQWRRSLHWCRDTITGTFNIVYARALPQSSLQYPISLPKDIIDKSCSSCHLCEQLSSSSSFGWLDRLGGGWESPPGLDWSNHLYKTRARSQGGTQWSIACDSSQLTGEELCKRG